jgi:hypothetical protein
MKGYNKKGVDRRRRPSCLTALIAELAVMMTGRGDCRVFRALIAVRIRILVDLARTTFRSRVLNAGSVVGHGRSGEAERERSRYKPNCGFT